MLHAVLHKKAATLRMPCTCTSPYHIPFSLITTRVSPLAHSQPHVILASWIPSLETWDHGQAFDAGSRFAGAISKVL